MYSLALRFFITCARPSLRIRIPSSAAHLVSMYVYMYVCIYVSRLGMRALRANVSITCVGVTHAGSRRDKPACTYCMQRHSNATHRATRRQPRQATTLLECATLDRQAHRARPELSPAMTVSRVGTGYLCILPMMY